MIPSVVSLRCFPHGCSSGYVIVSRAGKVRTMQYMLDLPPQHVEDVVGKETTSRIFGQISVDTLISLMLAVALLITALSAAMTLN